MKRIVCLSITLVIAFFTAACSQQTDTHDADVKTIQDLEAQWNKDWASKDADKISSYYEDDAVLMISGAPPDSGKDAITNALKQMVSDPALSLKFQPSRVDVSKSGDLAYTQGTYTLTVTDPQTKHVINDHGSYVTTYRKQTDGSWKAVMDIAVSEAPPPAPVPAATTPNLEEGEGKRIAV